MSKLDPEEQEILAAVKSGNTKRSMNADEIQKRHQEYAEAMFRKDARINIRLPSKDLRGLQKSIGGRNPVPNPGSQRPS